MGSSLRNVKEIRMILEFKKPKPTKEAVHLNAIINQMKRYYKPGEMSSSDIAKVITPFLIYLRKYGLNSTFSTLKNNQQILTIVTALLGELTPDEIMLYYPVTKYYQGGRWQVKDYYSTLEYISTIPSDKPIGKSFEEVFSFIWEYQNRHIKALGVAIMRNLDKFQEMTGKETFKEYLVRVPEPSKLDFTVIKRGEDQE